MIMIRNFALLTGIIGLMAGSLMAQAPLILPENATAHIKTLPPPQGAGSYPATLARTTSQERVACADE